MVLYNHKSNTIHLDRVQLWSMESNPKASKSYSVAYLEISRGGWPWYILGVHFQKCSKSSIVFSQILVQNFFTSKGMGAEARPLNTCIPLELLLCQPYQKWFWGMV